MSLSRQIVMTTKKRPGTLEGAGPLSVAVNQLVYSFRSFRMALLGRTPTIDFTTSPL